jgi:single-stranded-DNA-specific exonuclease
VRRLEEDFHLTPLAARLLAVRDLRSTESVKDFLHPALSNIHDPLLLKDMDKAVQRIARALEHDERMAVYGDYDVDGLSATALLVRLFRKLGKEVDVCIPHRLDEGYGMSCTGVENLANRGADLIITVDNGISCGDEVRRAKELGLDVIITDHHQPESELPDATAVVNPNRADCDYPCPFLSGCGVAFKLAHALTRHIGMEPETAKPFLVSLLDLVALGTIADVMPLLGENRILALRGLEQLKNTDKIGLRAMAELQGLDDKPYNAGTVGFRFGPRLNAAGRTGNACDALDLLLTDDRNEAMQLARHLDRLNQERRDLEGEVLQDAFRKIEAAPQLLQSPVLVIAGESWHQGVVGIVASRLLDRFGRPAVVLSIEEGEAKGSARSIATFDMLGALTACDAFLTEYGGHTMAAGVTLPAKNIEAFREALADAARAIAGKDELTPSIELDTVATPEELTRELMDDLQRFRPFGQDNPPPLIALERCELAGPPFEIGGKHLKMRLQCGSDTPLTAMWFHYPEPHEEIKEMLENEKFFDIAGTPRLNFWNGVEAVEFNIRDLRPSQP